MIRKYLPATGRGNKFNARKTKCLLSGHEHPSKLEAGFCDQLHDLLKKGLIRRVAVQVKFSLDVAGHHICNHIVDFMVEYQDGKTVVFETKGFETPSWRIKKKLFEALYPHLEYRVVK